MKQIIGFILVIAGVIFGVWAGLWWAFIGGIVDVISAIRAPEFIAMDVAIGVAKVMFAGAIGSISALIAILPGWAMIQD